MPNQPLIFNIRSMTRVLLVGTTLLELLRLLACTRSLEIAR